MRKSGTHRAHRDAGEPAAPVAADHHELGLLGFLDEPVGRLVADESSLNLHIGKSRLPSRQRFSQKLCAAGFVVAPVHAEDREDADIAPRVQRDKLYPPARRFIESQRNRRF